MLVKTIKKREISAVTGRAYTRKFIQVTNEVHKEENYDVKTLAYFGQILAGIAGAKIIGPESNLTDKALERMLTYLVDNFYITRKNNIHFK